MQQLGRDGGEAEAKDGRCHDARNDRAPALLRRQAGGGKADDHGIVAGEHQVDGDDLEQCGERLGGDWIGHSRIGGQECVSDKIK